MSVQPDPAVFPVSSQERSDEAIHLSFRGRMDCFRLRSMSYRGQVAEPVIGRRFRAAPLARNDDARIDAAALATGR